MNIVEHALTASAQLTAPGSPFELKRVNRGADSLLVYQHAPNNLAEIVELARRDDDAPFLIYQDESWSYQRFFQELDALALWFHQQGIGQGSRVALALRNRPEWAIAFAALAKIGAVPAPLNSFGQGGELRSALDDLMPELLICDKDRWLRLESDTGVSQCTTLVVDDNYRELSGVSHYADAICIDNSVQSKDSVITLPLLDIKADDPALILFTSGATSKAKAVVSTHQAVCQGLFNIDYIGAVSAMTSPETVKHIMDQCRESVILTAVPLFHVSGLHAQFLSALRMGKTLVFMHRWDPKDAVAMMNRYQVTQFNGAPSMVMQLLREPDFFKPELLEGFFGLGFGGAGLPESLVNTVLAKLPKQMIGIGFGMTESNGVGAAASGDVFRYNPLSSGLISPIMQVKICDPLGDTMPLGETGEICMKGVSLMQGYLNDPAATIESMRDGWLLTGDLGYINQDGFLMIVDRLKDVINRAGENIAAAEIESCLMLNNSVKEAAVFGVPDESTGEAIIAVVTVTPWEGVNEESLKQHVGGLLASYKVPVKIHIVEQKLPRNPAGKLLRNQLKQDFAN